MITSTVEESAIPCMSPAKTECIFTEEMLMTNSDYPADISAHVRDPKIIKREDGYYMVLGARDKESKGLVLVYRSDDLTNWKYHGRITTENAFGYMWECPDLLNWMDSCV